jgi:riboflavin synthase
VFTGIVEEIGEVVAARDTDDVLVLTVRGPVVASDARPGDSIAVNGVCLTVVEVGAPATGSAAPGSAATGSAAGRTSATGTAGPGGVGAGGFTVELVPETLKRTSLADVGAGTRVNLERAVAVGGRLGGHIVQGHVDGVSTLLSRRPGTRSDDLRFALPPDLARYVVEKGSITVDGVSLTVADTDGATFTVALIPTTLAHTTLGARAPGDTVNLEVDVVAKYIERLTRDYVDAGHGSDEPGEQGMVDR